MLFPAIKTFLGKFLADIRYTHLLIIQRYKMILTKLKKYTLAAVLACAVSLPVTAAQELDGVVAIVNESVITQSQVNAMMFDMRRAMQAAGAPVPGNQALKKRAIEQLIGESLQLQVAERNDITASDADVNKTIANIAAQNGISVDQLKQALAQEGVSYAKFRSQIRDQIVVRELQRGLFGGKITVTDQEAKNYIRANPMPINPNIRYHVDDLLIPVSESAPQADINAAEKKAEDLVKKARAGESFTDLVTADPTLEYNDLDWRTASQLPAAFSKKIVTMNKNDISSPVQAANGFHLLKLLNKQGETPQLSLQQAKNIVYQQKLDKQVDAWIEKVRKSAFVKIVN
jgi:peptidyl-prolyl cis-trans isomerase SurA